MWEFAKLFSIKEICKSIKEDLVGKDSFRGFSLTYSWLANQFGHFSLGFIPTLILYSLLLIFIPKYDFYCSIYLATIIIGLWWTLFEMWNLLYPILSNKVYTKIVPFEKGKKSVFRPDWVNLALDTFTDVCYFWLGALACNLFIQITQLHYVAEFPYSGAFTDKFLFFSNAVLFVLNNVFIIGFKNYFFILVVLIVFLSYYWYTSRMNLQSASLPKQFRLGQFTGEICGNYRRIVEEFKMNHQNNDHLLIAGFDKTGKTDLAIALGNEFAFKFKKVYYATFMKFLSKIHDCDRTVNQYWKIEDADLIIIDDLNIGRPYFKDFVSAKRFFDIIDDARNHNFFKYKKIIWVIGYKNDYDLENWKHHIFKYFNKINIKEIQLGRSCRGNS